VAEPAVDTTAASRRASPFTGWIAKALAVLGPVAFVLLVIRVARLGALPWLWLLIGTVVGGALVLAVAVLLWQTKGRGHRVRLILLAELTVIGLLLATIVFSAVQKLTTTLFVDIQRSDEVILVYDVIALNDHADGAEALAGETIGYLATDPNGAEARAELLKDAAVEYKPYANLLTLAEALTEREIDAFFLDDAYLPVYREEMAEFYDTVKIVHTFKIAAHPSAVPTLPASEAEANDDGSFIIYISGIDQSGSISVRGRSDVNILAVINPTTGRILLVHTPRDYYVMLHGTSGTPDKLTHSGIYGIDMSVATMEDLYGIHIDYYLRVNFTTVVSLVDLIGGVDVYSDYDFVTNAGAAGYHFTMGYNHCDGAAALAFARERYAFAGGDRVRGQNQERLIEAIIHKMAQPSMLPRFQSILDTMASGMETSMPGEAMMALVNRQLSENTTWTIERMSVDGQGAMEPTYSMGAQLLSVIIPDMSTVEAAKAAIADVMGD
jgi:LCP family protein required for cell wall assembly